MKKELMDKEVLCMFDTRQIQKFMFRSNSMLDTIGGSDLMVHIMNDAILYALHNIDTPLSEDEYDLNTDRDAEIPYFTNEKIKFQLIICTAGNARCLVRTGELAQKIIRKISRYYLENGYSLNMTAAATLKTDNFGEDTFHLYDELTKIKAAGSVSNPLGALSIIRKESNSGEPVIGIDPKMQDPISKSSEIRRKEGRKRPQIMDISDIKSTESAGKDYVAVVHADGNNFGIIIGRILQATTSYEDGIRKNRFITRFISENIRKLMEQTKEDLKKVYTETFPGEDDFEHAFTVVQQAGDDINIIMNPSLVFPLVEIFYKNIDRANQSGSGFPFFAYMGIAFVSTDHSFLSAFEHAEECCANAKAVAKSEENLRNGFAGSWIDFHICDNPNTQELDILRETVISVDGVNLLLRPYCIDSEAKDEDYYYNRLMQRATAMKEMPNREEWRRDIGFVYMHGKMDLQRWIDYTERYYHVEIKEKLGSAFYKKKGEPDRATWYDPAQIIDFIV